MQPLRSSDGSNSVRSFHEGRRNLKVRSVKAIIQWSVVMCLIFQIAFFTTLD